MSVISCISIAANISSCQRALGDSARFRLAVTVAQEVFQDLDRLGPGVRFYPPIRKLVTCGVA